MKAFFLILFFLSHLDATPPTLNISFNTHPTTLHPGEAADFVSSTLVCMLYEGLTRSLPGGSVELALAEKVETEGTVYTFHLRNAFWSNGDPITAYDFERSWKEVIGTPTPCTFLFYPIKGVIPFLEGKGSIDQVAIRALEPHLFQVELEAPTPHFYSLTALPSFLPSKSKQETKIGTLPTHPFGIIESGPFQIEKMIPNHQIVLRKNRHYWNKDQIEIDRIEIAIVADEMTNLHLFERGDLDWVGGSLSPLPSDAIETLREKLIYFPHSASTICTFNTREGPFQNKNLRKAFSLSIQRERLQEFETAPQSILPPLFSDQSFPLYDPEGALLYFEKGLSELQIGREGLEQLTLYFRSSQKEKKVAQILQKEWADLFGVTISLVQLDFKSHAQKLQKKNYDLALASWIAQYDDPLSILERFTNGEHLKNYSGWENPIFSNYLKEASSHRDRSALLAQAEELLWDESPITPLYHWNSAALCGSKIKSVAISSSGGVLFERFQLWYTQDH